jgi:hypothetical protein
METNEQIEKIRDTLNKVPSYINSASVDKVREFKKWRQKILKLIEKDYRKKEKIELYYIEITERYARDS